MSELIMEYDVSFLERPSAFVRAIALKGDLHESGSK